MRRIRLRDFFAGKPARHSRGEGGKHKPSEKPPLDTEGLMERALEADEHDIEGFAREAAKERRKLWHKVEDSVNRGETP